MIELYTRSFRATRSGVVAVRTWAHRHPVMARLAAAALLIVYFTLVHARAAHAASFLPDGADYTDSHGIPFSAYAVIDISQGDVLNPGVVIVNFVVQLMWSLQYFFTGVIIWLFGFLMTFEWVAWLAAPFNTLAIWLQDQLGTVNWIPFALMISALVAGIALFVGRIAGGLWEMLVAAILAVMAVGVLANPVATLTATDGMLAQAQSFGGQLATSIVVDSSQAGQTSETMSAAVTTTLMDLFVRIPFQVISYASVLPDACQGLFDGFLQSAGEGDPAALRSCSEPAAFFRDNPGGQTILYTFVNAAGITVLFTFGLVIAGLLIVSVFFFLVAAIKTMLLVYLCILPVDRAPLWRAVSDTFMGLISLVVMTVCLSLFLKLTTFIMGQTSFLPHQLRMVLLILFLIIMIVLIWRARRATLNAGRGIAGQLANLGLGMKATPKDSNALLKMATLTSMAGVARDLIKRKPSAPPTAAPDLADAAATTKDATATATASTAATASPRPQLTSSPTARALPPGPGARPAAPAGSKLVQTATAVGNTAAAAAKGAATGGVGGAVASAGTSIVSQAARKTAATAVTKAATVTSRASDIGELRVVQSPESNRIHVNDQGAAIARRRTPVYEITSLPPRPPASPTARAVARRRELEAYRPSQNPAA